MNYCLLLIVMACFTQGVSAAEPGTFNSVTLHTSDDKTVTLSREDAALFKTIKDLTEFSPLDEVVELDHVDSKSMHILSAMARAERAQAKMSTLPELPKNNVEQAIHLLTIANYLAASRKITNVLCKSVTDLLTKPEIELTKELNDTLNPEIDALLTLWLRKKILKESIMPAFDFKTFNNPLSLSMGKVSNTSIFGVGSNGIDMFSGHRLDKKREKDFSNELFALAFADKDASLVVSEYYNKISFYSSTTFKSIKEITTPEQAIWVDVDDSGSCLAYLSSNGTFHLYDLELDRNITQIKAGNAVLRCAFAHGSPLIAVPQELVEKSIRYTGDQRRESIETKRSIAIINARTGAINSTITTEGLVSHLVFTKDNKGIFAAINDVIYLYDIESGVPISQSAITSPIRSLSLNPSGSSLAIATQHHVFIFSTKRFSTDPVVDRLYADIIKTDHSIVSIGFNYSGEYLITALKSKKSFGYYYPRDFLFSLGTTYSALYYAALYKLLFSPKSISLKALNAFERELIGNPPAPIQHFIDTIRSIKKA